MNSKCHYLVVKTVTNSSDGHYNLSRFQSGEWNMFTFGSIIQATLFIKFKEKERFTLFFYFGVSDDSIIVCSYRE